MPTTAPTPASTSTSAGLEAPSKLKATPGNYTQVFFTWQVNSTTQTGYDLEVSHGGGDFQTIASPASDAVSTSVGNIIPGTNYTFKIRAVGPNGVYSPFSNEVTATSLSFGGPAPASADASNPTPASTPASTDTSTPTPTPAPASTDASTPTPSPTPTPTLAPSTGG